MPRPAPVPSNKQTSRPSTTISQHRLVTSPCFLCLIVECSSLYVAKRALTPLNL